MRRLTSILPIEAAKIVGNPPDISSRITDA
jgi:hypothetical protein